MEVDYIHWIFSHEVALQALHFDTHWKHPPLLECSTTLSLVSLSPKKSIFLSLLRQLGVGVSLVALFPLYDTKLFGLIYVLIIQWNSQTLKFTYIELCSNFMNYWVTKFYELNWNEIPSLTSFKQWNSESSWIIHTVDATGFEIEWNNEIPWNEIPLFFMLVHSWYNLQWYSQLASK